MLKFFYNFEVIYSSKRFAEGDVLIFLIILLVALVLFTAVVLYFFSIAFVKHNMGNVDDVEAEINKPLWKYKDEIKAGLDYINSRPFEWVETVSFDGLKLAARYFDNKSEKTVILFHGYRSSAARDFSCAVEMYTKFGFNILLCDQRSHGRSEGRLITFGVKESRDVLSWIEFAENKYEPEKIILGGMSMGATTVLLACGYPLPDTVRGVVADCGFTSPVDIIKKVAKQSFKINASFFIPFLNLCCKLFGKFSITKTNTVDSLKKSKIPVLLIHGANDGFVPCEMSQKAYESTGENGHLVLIDGANHGMSYLTDKTKVETEIKIFFKKCV